MSAYNHDVRVSPTRASTARIAVDQGTEPEDWRAIYERMESSSPRLTSLVLKGTAAVATLLGLFAVSGTLGLIADAFFDDVSEYFLACLVVPPGILAGAAAGQYVGNLFLRFRFRLDDATRRGFATRLTLARAPAAWPTAVRRWLFTGDWLGSPAYDLRLPYVRIFVAGDAPVTCREEDELWREIHDAVSGAGVWEAGSNHREISYPRQLPGWAKSVEAGDGFVELQKRIGRNTAAEWVSHLWRRACGQWPGLGCNGFPAQSRRECFEIHFLTLYRGRHALVVVLRPSTFVEEMETKERREELAA